MEYFMIRITEDAVSVAPTTPATTDAPTTQGNSIAIDDK